jgi:hypothetical protein
VTSAASSAVQAATDAASSVWDMVTGAASSALQTVTGAASSAWNTGGCGGANGGGSSGSGGGAWVVVSAMAACSSRPQPAASSPKAVRCHVSPRVYGGRIWPQESGSRRSCRNQSDFVPQSGQRSPWR